MATERTKKQQKSAPKPELNTEVANRLRDPFEQAYQGIVEPNDPVLLEKGGGRSIQIYQDLLTDGKVFSGLQKRTLALVGREWTIEPVDEGGAGTADAETLTRILKGLPFDQVCQDLLVAIVCGYAVSEIVWAIREGNVVPDRVIQRAQRRFKFVQVNEHLPPELRLLTRENMLTGEVLPPRKFIVHRVNPQDDNPYGMGLGRQLFWPVFFKRAGVISWNKLNDRFGNPTPWGRYPSGATPAQKRTLFDALVAMSNDGVVMTPVGTEIELLESRLTGSVSTQKELCTYMDDWISEVLLGTEPRGSGGGALAAAAKERTDVRLDLVQGDSDLLSDTLNRTLIAWICEYNGLRPCKIYRVIKEEEDLQASAETDKTVSEMGFELDEDSVRSKYGEGWSKKKTPEVPPPVPPGQQQPGNTPPVNQPGAQPANFAEGGDTGGQAAIDAAIATLSNERMQAAMEAILSPLIERILAADSFEDALAAMEAAFPQADPSALQSLLANAMFGAEAFARQEPEA
jgi:phage gp29-like protein